MAGLLVVPDTARLPLDVPAIHHADFERVVGDSGMASYETLLYPERRSRAFGLVETLSSHVGPLFITPPEVMRDQSVRAWRLGVVNRGGGHYFWLCDRAEAVLRDGPGDSAPPSRSQAEKPPGGSAGSQ